MKASHLFIAAAALSAAWASAQDLTLIREGRPEAVIAVPDAMKGSCIPDALRLLNTGLKDMSGTELPIVKVSQANLERIKGDCKGKAVMLLGKSAWTDDLQLKPPAKPDAFTIKTIPGAVALLGNDEYVNGATNSCSPVSKGSLYAAIRFLESQGMRVFGERPASRIVENKADITVKQMECSDAPYFIYRETGNIYRRKPHHIWSGYGGTIDLWTTKHTFQMWRNWGELFTKTHPEYFCLNKSNCLSNNIYMIAFPHSGVVDEVVREAKGYFSSQGPKGIPGLRYFNMNQNDYFEEPCVCEACQAQIDRTGDPRGWFSDYVSNATVKVAEAVAKDFPDAKIVQSAYEHYTLPPKGIDVYPSNVIVAISQHRSRLLDDRSLREAMELVDAWQRRKPGGIAFQRYYNSFGNSAVPRFFPHAIVRNIKAMKEADGKYGVPILGEMHYGSSGGAWWYDLTEHLTARALWNPDMNVDALLDDFCHTSFGPAASSMRKMLDHMEDLHLQNPDRTSYSAAELEKLRKCVDEASATATAKPFSERVAHIADWFRQLEAVMQAQPSGPAATAMDAAPKPKIKYDFEGELSDIVNDSSGNGRHAILVGAKRVQAEGGKSALEFNGQGDYIKLREAYRLGETYSLEALIRPYPMDAKSQIFGELAMYRAYHIFGAPANCHGWDKVSISLRGGKCMFHEQGDASISGDVILESDKWHHIVGARAADGSMKLYIDGRLSAFSTPKKTDARRPLLSLIGASGGVSSRYGDTIADCRGFFYGMMDGIRVYDSELSPGQVKAAYEEATARK